MKLDTQYSAKNSRSSMLQTRILVELPDSSTSEMSGRSLAIAMSGEFKLGSQHFSFDGETLFLGEQALVTYNYSGGLMGVGEDFTISDLEGELILALRPTRRRKLLITYANDTAGEITWSFFGQVFHANTQNNLPSEYALLCLWVAMTRMVT